MDWDHNSRMIRYVILLGFLISPALAGQKQFDITQFGAAPGAKAKVTAAIRDAIAAAARDGGGTVHIPSGAYLTGQIILQSNVTLDLAENATLLFSTDADDYPPARVRWEGTECYSVSPLIYAHDAAHIAITGKGMLDGQGKDWWGWSKKAGETSKKLKAMGEKNVPVEERRFTKADFLRPNFIGLYNCTDVRIEGVTIINSPMWIIHPVFCDGVVVRGCTIKSAGPNTDGCDPDSTRNVLVENCHFDCGDDSMAIKSGRDADGRRVNRPTEHVIVRHCAMIGGHAGVAIGSESSGSIRDVKVSDCLFEGGGTGIRLKTMRGRGGIIEDIHFDHITMRKTSGEAIILTMNYQKTTPEPASDRTPTMRNITIFDCTGEGAKRACLIAGLEERAIQNVTLTNITLAANTGLSASFADGVTLNNVKITPAKGEAMTWDRCANVMMDGHRP
jgi:polygalacturonase